VGNVKYKVYKLVFCTLSKFFEKAVKNFKEAETGVVELKHGDEKLLHQLVAWFKTGEYCNGELCRSAKEPRNDKEADISINNLVANGEEEVVADPDDEAEEWTGDQKCRHPLTFHVNMFALAGNFFCSHSHRNVD
jgi:hypothetical protein